jgi:hypothetical protein
MILYHGSNIEIETIDLSKSKPNKDFGKAFYLSEEMQQAKEMAAFTVDRFGGKPIITSFEFDKSLLRDRQLKVKTYDGYSREWAEFIFFQQGYGFCSQHTQLRYCLRTHCQRQSWPTNVQPS